MATADEPSCFPNLPLPFGAFSFRPALYCLQGASSNREGASDTVGSGAKLGTAGKAEAQNALAPSTIVFSVWTGTGQPGTLLATSLHCNSVRRTECEKSGLAMWSQGLAVVGETQ